MRIAMKTLRSLIDSKIVALEDVGGNELTPDQAVDRVDQETVLVKALSGNVYRLDAYDGAQFHMVEETIVYKVSEVDDVQE